MARSPYGADLWQAWDRLETLEHTAKIAILSRVLGGSRNLSPDAIEKLINVREASGYLDEGARCQHVVTCIRRISLARRVIVRLFDRNPMARDAFRCRAKNWWSC
jgi:hypothetical protein